MRRLQFLCLLLPLLFIGCEGLTIDPKSCCPEEGSTPSRWLDEQQAQPTREVLFFSATWCKPCQEAKPRIEELRKQGMKVTEIDIDQHPELAQKYRITQVPTFIVLEDGVEIKRTSSVLTLIIILVKILRWLAVVF